MNVKDIVKIVNRTEVITFVPNSLLWLTEQKHIHYKSPTTGKEDKLKTAYLLDIVHTLISKTNKYKGMDSKKDEILEGFPLSSKIMMKNYHNNYSLYLEYLEENNIIVKTKNHSKGLHAKKWRLNFNIEEESYKYYSNTDRKIVRMKKERDLGSLIDPNLSSIDCEVRAYLYTDLFKVTIDEWHAKLVLDQLLETGKINLNKHKINTNTYESINARCLDYTFDPHGRFHSNFTRLRKEIRTTCLRVVYKGQIEETVELDIKNSQPMFLLLLLRDYLSELDLKEFNKYKDWCESGTVYDQIMRMYELSFSGETIKRKTAKEYLYQVLFGPADNKKIAGKMFKMMLPSISNWISKYKIQSGNYKIVAHQLQRLESDLIYNKIIKEIKEVDKSIPIITVHDSIIIPKSCLKIVDPIFEKHVNEVFSETLSVDFS